MIRYSLSLEQLRADIETESPGWLQRAQRRTEEFRTRQRYEETSSIWSEVKAVYMRLQGNCKCAYCERKLESLEYGKVEQDVEHFRPKGNIKAWRIPKALSDAGIPFTAAPDAGKGYYLLPYHPFNYAAACKPCNSVLKKDYFPIAGNHNLDADDPIGLLSEQPYLLYPIGDFDEKPEDIIEFIGLSPKPKATAGHRRNRALVTIEFFKLDDVAKRKNLFRERALIIIALYPQLQILNGNGTAAEKTESHEIITGFTSASAPHTNCALSFKRLYEAKPTEAEEFFHRAIQWITSMS